MTPTRDARALCQEIVDRNYFPESFTDDFRMLAHAYIALEQKLRAAEKVVKAARDTFNRQNDPHAKWAMEEIESALKEFDALRDGGNGG